MKRKIQLLVVMLFVAFTSFAQTQMVTFQVESPDSTPVSLIGSWNWGNWPGASMTAVTATKYSVTMPLLPNSPYEFLFVNGATPTKEVLNPAWSCTNGNAQYTNITLNLGANDIYLF